jgi:hypothetical protein
MQYYYAWQNHIDPNIFWKSNSGNPDFGRFRFYNFDFTNQKNLPSGVYVGFPGQFIGNKITKNSNDFSSDELPKNMRLLSSFKFEKHVSYGNGDQIWMVQVN